MKKGGYVYIMSNPFNTVLYTGVTSELKERVRRHKTNHFPGSFTSKYNVTKLVYFERFDDIKIAITREKQIKAGSRKNKIQLLVCMNPEWRDLYESI